MRNLIVFLGVFSFLTITNVICQGASSNNVNLTMQIMEDFKPTLNDRSSLDYANLTQRIQNYVIFLSFSKMILIFYFSESLILLLNAK